MPNPGTAIAANDCLHEASSASWHSVRTPSTSQPATPATAIAARRAAGSSANQQVTVAIDSPATQSRSAGDSATSSTCGDSISPAAAAASASTLPSKTPAKPHSPSVPQSHSMKAVRPAPQPSGTITSAATARSSTHVSPRSCRGVSLRVSSMPWLTPGPMIDAHAAWRKPWHRLPGIEWPATSPLNTFHGVRRLPTRR